MCNFAHLLASTSCCKKVRGHISAERHQLSPGQQTQPALPARKGKGLSGTLPMGPELVHSSGYLYEFTKSRWPKTTDYIYFLLKNLLFLFISL